MDIVACKQSLSSARAVYSHNIYWVITITCISVEMCLSSNLKSETVSSIEKHHLTFWQGRDHPFILCVS